MAKHILKCEECGIYTMEENCKCKGHAFPKRPPKYSPEDKYAGYRRKVKKDELANKGLC